MLFSQIVEVRNARSTAIDITAAGIDDANVSPTLSPTYTLAAVKTTVINAPRMIPRTVSSTRRSRAVGVRASLTEAKAESPYSRRDGHEEDGFRGKCRAKRWLTSSIPATKPAVGSARRK